MKTKSFLMRFGVLSVLVACIGSSVSCMTTYDVYGRPMQTVDPMVAVAGVAAAGLIGYSAANNHHHREYYDGGYDGGGYYRGGDGPCD